MTQQKTCTISGQTFSITEDDRKVYKMFNVPEPTIAPNERHRRRTAFRNELNFYKRKCDLTGKEIVSNISPEKPYKVYGNEAWWSDSWDPCDYGQDFDFTRPFFEQFKELSLKVPRPATMTSRSINCDYTNHVSDAKDCYLSARIGHGEGIMYTHLAVHCTGCIDCMTMYKSQYCYECIDCWSCYECFYCQLCKNSNNSWFCYDCIGCSDCFGCIGLRNKKFHFFNQKCTEEEYKKKVTQYNLGSYKIVEYIKGEFQKHLLKLPKRNTIILNSENVTGNYIAECKNIFEGYDMEQVEDSRYTWGGEYSKDIYDCNFIYYGERNYELIANTGTVNSKFGFIVIDSHDVDYSIHMYNGCGDCFGCIGMKRKKYCILNKQYTKEQYEKLLPKIIEHMKSTKEYGEFFPIEISDFGYNESVAGEYFPLTKEEALSKGYKWKDQEPAEYLKPTMEMSDDIQNVTESITKEVFSSKQSGRNFKITKEELKFYKRYGLPLPQLHFLERHANRLKLRNPRKLWKQNCQNCQVKIMTAYSPEKPEIVYCEKCYLQTVN